MNESRSSKLLGILLALAVINIGMTGYLIVEKNSPSSTPSSKMENSSQIKKDLAVELAKPMVAAYNNKDSEGLYAQFSELARIQFSKEKLEGTLNGLYPITGKIKEYVYSYSQAAGEQDGKKFIVIFYKLRLEGGSMPAGEMKLTVALEDGKFGIYGFFINALQQ